MGVLPIHSPFEYVSLIALCVKLYMHCTDEELGDKGKQRLHMV